MIGGKELLSVIQSAQAAAARATESFRLSLSQLRERFLPGQHLGTGVGNSIEFHEYRPYSLGDDLRHVDWRAYARTDSYIMKLYRAEVSPRVDLVLDLSPSMCAPDEKLQRLFDTALFITHSARRLQASVLVAGICGSDLIPLTEENLLRADFDLPGELRSAAEQAPLALREVPFRQGAVRIFVTDLLYPLNPHDVVSILGQRAGNSVLFVPVSASERDPDWGGEVVLRERETGEERRLFIGSEALQKYRERYQRHFTAWREAAVRSGVGFARIESELPFLDALRREPLKRGIVELWR